MSVKPLKVHMFRKDSAHVSQTHAMKFHFGYACSAGGLEAYGADPTFNPQSSMYSSISLQQKWRYFNASDNSPEVSLAGVPFAFYSRPSSGYGDGFPVFFPVLGSHLRGNDHLL